MNRRDFLALAGATAAAWPLGARAQQAAAGAKRLGFLFTLAQDDPQTPNYLTAMRTGLKGQGWEEGRNLTVRSWWSANTTATSMVAAREVAAYAPDIVLSVGTSNATELYKVARPFPTAFALVTDPVGMGFVDSLSHPGTSMTGFTNVEPSIGGKLVELLKEIVPDLNRIGTMVNPDSNTSFEMLAAIQSAAAKLGLEYLRIDVRTPADIAAAVATFASQPGTGVAIGTDAYLLNARATILAEVAKQKLPAAYWHVLYAMDGGMTAYATDPFDVLQKTGDYAGRILNGTKVSDLPVQAPSKYQLTVNLKTAKALGIAIPNSVLIRADAVIE